jgi:hypothetical protein
MLPNAQVQEVEQAQSGSGAMLAGAVGIKQLIEAASQHVQTMAAQLAASIEAQDSEAQARKEGAEGLTARSAAAVAAASSQGMTLLGTLGALRRSRSAARLASFASFGASRGAAAAAEVAAEAEEELAAELAAEESAFADLAAQVAAGGQLRQEEERQPAPQLPLPTEEEVACIPRPSLPPLAGGSVLAGGGGEEGGGVVGMLMARLERVWSALGVSASDGMGLVLRWVLAAARGGVDAYY